MTDILRMMYCSFAPLSGSKWKLEIEVNRLIQDELSQRVACMLVLHSEVRETQRAFPTPTGI